MIDFEFDFQYENEKIPALKNAKGGIEDGKCIVLCGGSGCGKSTLLRCLNGLIPKFYEGELNGFCRINGKSTEDMPIGEIGETAASVFQDPRSQFFTINSSGEIAFGLENHGVSHNEMHRRVNEAFSVFHLEKLKDRNVYELSSGERQLIAILSAWAMNADILLLDEPTANLDFSAIEQLREILLAMKTQGRTMIFSEHRLYYLTGLADEYWLMADGEIKRKFTAAEMTALAPNKVSALSLRTLNLDDVRVEQSGDISPPKSDDIFSLENIQYRYGAKAPAVLSGVTLEAKRCEVVGLIGANGCGKTTFGKITAGLLEPSGGSISYCGEAIRGKRLREKVMFIMQEAEFQFFTNSVMNELKYGNKDSPAFQEKAERLLKRLGMWECRNRHPFSLSGGQMQKLTLLTAYLSEKPVVVLDEPTAGLDAESLSVCCELICDMKRDKTVFIITHDIELIARVCTRCICLADGKAKREFGVKTDADLRKITAYMRTELRSKEVPETRKKPQKAGLFHPVTKLLYLLAAMTIISTSDNSLAFSVYAALLIMIAADGRIGSALTGGGIFAMLCGLNFLFPNTALSFALVLFPRILALGLIARTLIGRNEASRTLAAFRKIHLPEKLIMIFAVIFRFFPVLSGDMKLLRQSVRTRGVFATFGQKLKALPEYIEILTVPMALRVIRIAETLSASAETRGIDLRRKKSTYVSLRYGAWDIIFTLLLIGAAAVGFLLNV